MAEAGKEQVLLGVTGGAAAQWPLQRYGRFMPLGTGEPPRPDQGAGTASSPTWKVFDSSEESGYLVLTIVISGPFLHFTRTNTTGRTKDRSGVKLCGEQSRRKPNEGFSLVGSKDWLKIVRRVDCLLFGTTIKNKSRMFRVQFGGGSKEQALEHCCSCVQTLAQYITVQVPDGISQELQLNQGPLKAGEGPGKGCVQSSPLKLETHQTSEQESVPARTSTAGARTSVTWLAQSILASEELPLVYQQSAWNVEELGPFLRLCLMDQNFPAFVEEVEKELKKLTGLRK